MVGKEKKMPFRLGWPELIIVLAILLLLFGGRLSKIAGELAKSIKIFRKNFDDKNTESEEDLDE